MKIICVFTCSRAFDEVNNTIAKETLLLVTNFIKLNFFKQTK